MPDKLQTFMRMVMKEAQRMSLMDLLESRGISEKEYDEIRKWFDDRGIHI